ncbi:uncharacterized protein RJT20DRAFT_132117 [Scheffersomyces xylosifermentans]|uniref:uncharacterized protein n=1 Tax=Scheffersomyces xylosifermentans TaxID=1304137 RepID=UPI00315CE2A1
MSVNQIQPQKRYPENEFKRRKLDQPIPIHSNSVPMSSQKFSSAAASNLINQNGTIVNSSNGTVTPSNFSSVASTNDDIDMISGDNFAKKSIPDMMDISYDGGADCPCGYFHGPGQGHHHDLKAIGFSSQPLMRGPD